MEKTNFVLIGHTGFIGKYILNNLIQRKIQVKGISSENIDLRNKKSVHYISQLINKKTVIIIASAITRELGDNLNSMLSNIKMIANIASALEKNPVKKCVFLSSADVYGKPNGPISERLPLNPKTYYSLAKICCEKMLEISLSKTQTPLLILRYNGVFGPGQKNIGYGPNYFINSILKEEVVKIWGDGKDLRDSLYVKDLAKIICALGLNDSFGILNIASGKSRSFVDILKILKKISSKKFSVEKRNRTSPFFNQTFDISKLKKTIPNIKFAPFEKSLEETYKGFNNFMQ